MTGNAPSRASGWWLVAVQGLIIVGVLWWPSDYAGRIGTAVIPGFVLLGLAVVGGAAAVGFLGRSLTPHPDPNGAGLVANGIYRWVRHPMYGAVVAGCAGVACLRGLVVPWALTLALAVFFEIKSRREESRLAVTYPGYAEYAARTGKFVPLVGKRPIAG